MSENIIDIAKEAYVLSQQLDSLQDVLAKQPTQSSYYHAAARTYTTHLHRAKEILKLDPVILKTIQHRELLKM